MDDKFSRQHAPEVVPSVTEKSSGLQYLSNNIEPRQPQTGTFPETTKNDGVGTKG